MDGISQAKSELAAVGPERFTARDYRRGAVKHIVLFRFKPQVTAEQAHDVVRRFLDLSSTPREDGNPYIVSIAGGAQISSEEGNHEFEYGFIVEFSSLGDRNYYLGRPIVTDERFYDSRHDDFKVFVGPLLRDGADGVLVFDFQG